ncbi:MAG TPA: glycosyltransferase [Haliangiales bacterium]|nr:glycosyltransferase [Haliangiales bacterium]
MRAAITVPCFNEANRLRPDGFAPLLAAAEVVFVDDGSTDDTHRILEGVAASAPERAFVLRQEANAGKAEAVRRGMSWSMDRGAAAVGYLDADLSTPAEEMVRLLGVLDETGATAVLGSRVAILGAHIERSTARHLLGRVFATGASAVLKLPIYDTQCGAKAFRATPALRAALAEPFHSRWAFDVELLGRLIAAQGGPDGIREVPLVEWRDVGGSTLRFHGMLRAGLDLARVAVELSRFRRRK